jgi:osmotically-inducible protein OsmY
MTNKRTVRSGFIILTLTALFSIALFANGCNTVQPPARQATDAQITTQVKAKLASDVRASSLANIDVNTTNGVVTLAGEVESPEVRSKAEAAVASVSGVVRVNDNLQVASSSASVNR